MAHQNKNNIPPQSFFRAIDKIYADKYAKKIRLELNGRSDLMNLLNEKLESFIIWAGNERLSHEANLEEEVKDFMECNFIDRKRMYSFNSKKWIKIAKLIFERDNYTCAYCGKVGGKLEVDHIVPFIKGGDDNMNNLITSCRKCNRQKKDKSVEEFLEWKKTNK